MKYDPNKITGNNHRDIESLHPIVQEKAKIFLNFANDYANKTNHQVKIVSTLRNAEEQQKLYDQGRTKPGKKVTDAKPGTSTHNWGVGFDIGIFSNGAYLPEHNLYTELGRFANKAGLQWGGNWNKPDRPHYQFIGNRTNAEFFNKVRLDNLDSLLTS